MLMSENPRKSTRFRAFQPVRCNRLVATLNPTETRVFHVLTCHARRLKMPLKLEFAAILALIALALAVGLYSLVTG
jgi:hypothetical protein